MAPFILAQNIYVCWIQVTRKYEQVTPGALLFLTVQNLVSFHLLLKNLTFKMDRTVLSNVTSVYPPMRKKKH